VTSPQTLGGPNNLEATTALFSASRDRLIKLWQVQYANKKTTSKVRLVANLDGHDDWVNDIKLIPSARTLVSCSNDTTIKVWRLQDTFNAQVETKRVLPISTLEDHEDYVRTICYSEASGRLFSAADNGVLNLWDLHAERLI